MRWAGVDVGGRRKGFHVAVVDDDLTIRLHRASSPSAAAELLGAIAPKVVGIDSPRAWADAGDRSRACERAFAAARICGIRFTPDAATAAARTDTYFEWIEHGLELWAACEDRGIEVFECFPTASWSAWFGSRGPRSRAAWTRDAIQRLGLPAHGARSQDDRDAIAAALTARQRSLDPNSTCRFGDLVVPQPGSSPTGEALV